MGKYNFDKTVNRLDIGAIKFGIIKKNNEPQDTIPLWIADMDFEACEEIKSEIQNVAQKGSFGYTDFGSMYFETVSNWLKENHDIEVKEEEMISTPGVIVALSMGVRSFTNELDSVIIMSPVYNPFREVIRNNNRKLIESQLLLKGNRYYIDFEDFENKIKENKVKLFILCSPHNPVGRVWEIEELTKISEICEKYNVKIISDEIHFDFVWKGKKHIPFYKVSEYARNNSCTCTAPSKTFNLAGVQDSNIIIYNKELRENYIKEYNKFGYHRISQFAQVATVAAYKYGNSWLNEVKNYIYENICFVKSYIEENTKNISVVDIEGTYLMWLDFRKFNLSDDELQKKLIYEAKVHLDNGLKFGAEGFMRMNVATSRDSLNKALSNMQNVFK